ncbi:hypothetical protein HDE_08828 [Halotydeus destructor]|nr:hypothetical protein HDE_08828 [Halotydeus destructor]
MIAVKVVNCNPLRRYFEVRCEYVVSVPKQPHNVFKFDQNFMVPFYPNINWKVNVLHKNLQEIVATLTPENFRPDVKCLVSMVKFDGSRPSTKTHSSHAIGYQKEYEHDGNKFVVVFQVSIENYILSKDDIGRLALYESIKGESPDFDIKATDGTLRVLKTSLMKWDYFRTMVQANCSESETSVWVVDDFSIEIMRDVVGFVCCNVVTFRDEDHAIKMMEAGHRYLLNDLLKACSNYLIAFLNINNALSLLVLSDMYDQDELKLECSVFIGRRIVKHDVKDLHGYAKFRELSNCSKLIEGCFENAVRQMAALKK